MPTVPVTVKRKYSILCPFCTDNSTEWEEFTSANMRHTNTQMWYQKLPAPAFTWPSPPVALPITEYVWMCVCMHERDCRFHWGHMAMTPYYCPSSNQLCLYVLVSACVHMCVSVCAITKNVSGRGYKRMAQVRKWWLWKWLVFDIVFSTVNYVAKNSKRLHATGPSHLQTINKNTNSCVHILNK